ncbi:MAG: PepSY domain-containing protein [Candidatus Cyclobacteriaceae bacterium M2_1C_046]
MKKLSIYFLTLLFAGFLVACGDDEDEILPINEQQAINQALASTSGTVTSTDPDTTSTGEVYYNVDIETDAGAVIEFEYFQADGSLKSIEGDNGPFDYELNPGMGLILFSAAKNAALTARPGEVQRWSLEKNNAGTWIYTFEILNTDTGEDFTVKINATTGAVISS